MKHREGYPTVCTLCGAKIHTPNSMRLHPCPGRHKMERALTKINGTAPHTGAAGDPNKPRHTY